MIKRSSGRRQKHVSMLIPVLCVGQMKDTPGATERWKGEVEGLRLYSSYQDVGGSFSRISIIVSSAHHAYTTILKEHFSANAVR